MNGLREEFAKEKQELLNEKNLEVQSAKESLGMNESKLNERLEETRKDFQRENNEMKDSYEAKIKEHLQELGKLK